ncbi:MAG: hypothetical protein B6D73_10740 [gamma proteobacterium symbiont of Stewartia floridana]|nr:MAG: hypothetical protein B6D73_10740 [gamma proteobacterium symbiont of Stewartia floridana]
MYFYVDESGQTGLNLFDDAQPFLFYGILSSRLNLDVLAEKQLSALRKKLGVKRLHAAELGNGQLVKIEKGLSKIKKKFDLRFDFYCVAKADHALISFFDQTFDQGLNPALPWTAYWTPMRYVLLIKLAYLFDEELLKKAWDARITTNNEKAEQQLVDVCKEVISRVGVLPDKRSRELITDGMNWVVNNPSEIGYNVDAKKDALQISPNLIGFQSVMHGIAGRLEKTRAKAAAVIVDRQSQFNKAQEFIADFYHKARHVPWVNGPGLPVMDLKHMPTVPITCTAGTDSAGLELVDIYIWVFKRHFEGKELAPELYSLIQGQLHRGRYDEVSISALMERWGKWFEELPEPTEEQMNEAKELHETQEARRKPHVVK